MFLLEDKEINDFVLALLCFMAVIPKRMWASNASPNTGDRLSSLSVSHAAGAMEADAFRIAGSIDAKFLS